VESTVTWAVAETIDRLRLYRALASLSFERQLTYRAAALAGLVTNFFFGLLRAAVLVALYGQRTEVAGMTLRDAVTYTGLTQAVIAYLSLFGWWDLMRTVYSGDVATDLLKPMDYQAYWLAQDVGRAAVALLTRGVTIMIAYALVVEITIPSSPQQWLALATSLVLALLVSFGWRFLVNLAAFWSTNATGFLRLCFALSWFLSGFLMPLRFFPPWVQTLCYLTPFPHAVNTVVEVYLGLLGGARLAHALALQAAWALGLLVAGQLVMRLGVRRLVIVGG
jgi:ABC-2 type transport system permease protein